jgi:pimeloyl-ACP methyl ester carboxylesterase
MREISINSKSGILHGFLHANDSSPRGLIICLHGGPGGNHEGAGNIFGRLAQIGTSLSYAVLQVDLFGSGDSEGTQFDFDLLSMVNDYDAVLSYARASFHCPFHIAGESMGSTVAAMNWQHEVASNLMFWPAFDLVDTDLGPYLSGSDYELAKRQGRIATNGIEMGFSFLDQINQYDFTQCFRGPDAPAIFFHGRGDPSVPFSQSTRAAKEFSGPVELHLLRGGDHGLTSDEYVAIVDQKVRQWLEKF